MTSAPESARPLAGKAALVTGGGKRLGRAIALALGASGVRVAVHHHASSSGAEETCTLIRQAGGEAFALAADLLDRDQTRSLVDGASERLGGLDLLVGNAGNFERIAVEALNDATYDRALRLNLDANYVLATRARAALKAAHGSIVFITCTSATTPFRNYLPYVVSKGALRQLMRVLSLEFAPEVRVNAIAPGTVLPPEDLTPSQLERLRERIPLSRFGSAEDIANAVLYLASAPFVSGVELVVDGGRSVAAR
ncbi:MAG TPA: SDR family oxidoreductase [Polyangiaceae bacterium]|nr:SDR family oxidoreductase [Polyangiaceae bacterium]